MLAEVTDELEVLPEASVMQHAPGVAADWEDTSSFDVVMPIKDKAMRVIGYRAAIDHCLPVILASGFQPVQLEQPISGRIKLDVADTSSQLGIGNIKRPVSDQPRVGKTVSLRQTDKVVPIQRATQTLTVQHRIIAHCIRHSAVGIDI